MKRFKYSLRHMHLLTAPLGALIPICWYEGNPGDTVRQSAGMLIRVTPTLAPIMHAVKIRVHHWFVPFRLLWDNWEPFITGGEDGLDASVWPFKSITTVTKGTLADYLQVPLGGHQQEHSAFPYRAYAKIYNEWYRDQQLIPEVGIGTGDGDDTTTNESVLNCSWEKDYFTASRPNETLGDSITIPLGDVAPVRGLGTNGAFSLTNQAVKEAGGVDTTYSKAHNIGTSTYLEEDPDNATYPNLFVDLSEAIGITVNEFREYLALQRFQEARNNYGSRYVEYLKYLMPGVPPLDARLDNPEYCGGGSQLMSWSEILQTAEGTNPVGTLRGHGITALRTNRFTKFIPEHGIIMSIMSVVPKAVYMQSLPKKFLRDIKEKYYQKELAFLGDEVVENREIYAAHSSPKGTFGFQTRYDSYRSHPSVVSGDFHDILNYWHYARDFDSDVALNKSFIDCVPTNRVYADQNNDPLQIQCVNQIQARRLLPRNPIARTF